MVRSTVVVILVALSSSICATAKVSFRCSSIRISADALKLASELRNEFCIQVTGTVRARDGEKNVNAEMATGAIEVLASV